MSEYLKWYDSYLDHTPTEDLAKNELESAHRKIKHATESLAKANEKIEFISDLSKMQKGEIKLLSSELEKTKERLANREAFVNELQVIQACRDRELERMDKKLAKANECVRELELVIVAITHADETGYVDDVGFVQGWSEVCDEVKSLINKFAIEKKIEVVNQVLGSERFDFADRPLDFGIRVESIEIILRDLEIELNSEQLRKEQNQC